MSDKLSEDNQREAEKTGTFPITSPAVASSGSTEASTTNEEVETEINSLKKEEPPSSVVTPIDTDVDTVSLSNIDETEIEEERAEVDELLNNASDQEDISEGETENKKVEVLLDKDIDNESIDEQSEKILRAADEEIEVNKQRKKKLTATPFFCLLIFLAVVFLISAMIYFFQVDTDSEDVAFLINPGGLNDTMVPTSKPVTSPSAAPTFLKPTTSPSSSPTFYPSTFGETSAPSNSPTSSPTRLPSELITSSPTVAPTMETSIYSELDCDDINEASQGGNHGENNFNLFEYSDTYICSDTYGPDISSPNRNPWAVAYGRRDCPYLTYEGGEDICGSVGARFCSLEESYEGVGQGTGCGADREYIWTYSSCVVDGLEGKYMFDYGLRDSRESAHICETNLSTLSLIRCCGDIF